MLTEFVQWPPTVSGTTVRDKYIHTYIHIFHTTLESNNYFWFSSTERMSNIQVPEDLLEGIGRYCFTKTCKEGLSSDVTEHFIPLQLAKNKGGGTPSGFGKT